MEDSLAIIFALIISIIIMFLFPLMDTWDLQDNLSYATTYATVVDFVDTVRNTGKLNLDVYNAFETKLGATGNTFDVTLEHRKSVLYEDDGKIVQGYLNVYTNEIMDKLETNEEYALNKYDYFYVTVKNTNKTQATVIRSFLMGDQETFKIGTAYGGVVWSAAD